MTFQIQIRLANGLDQLLAYLGNALLQLDLGNQYGKFITAQTCNQIVLPQYRTKPFGYRLQQGIADSVTKGVVDHLELVQIKEEHGVKLTTAFGPRQLFAGDLMKQHAIRNTGQEIM